MKNLKQYVEEKLVINKNYMKLITPNSREELRDIIIERQEDIHGDDHVNFNDIDISNIDNLEHLFYKTEYTNIDVSMWDTSHVESMEFLFGRCDNLKYVDISDWNVEKCSKFNGMFYNCGKLIKLDLSKWNMISATDLRSMFFYCTDLKSIGNISNWDIRKVQLINTMFCMCENIEDLGDLKNWQFGNVVNAYELFHGCENLKHIGDISSWRISYNCSTIGHMFYNCKNLNDAGDLTKWKINPATDKEDMFKNSGLKFKITPTNKIIKL